MADLWLIYQFGWTNKESDILVSHCKWYNQFALDVGVGVPHTFNPSIQSMEYQLKQLSLHKLKMPFIEDNGKKREKDKGRIQFKIEQWKRKVMSRYDDN